MHEPGSASVMICTDFDSGLRRPLGHILPDVGCFREYLSIMPGISPFADDSLFIQVIAAIAVEGAVT